jgi:signal transduction histidine kinase
MPKSLRVLLVEDSGHDAALVLRELRRGGYALTAERVDTPEAMTAALAAQHWDVVISDFSMPRFSAQAALAVMQKAGQELPFIIVSGTVGEEAAVEAMRAGAQDFMPKGMFHRLIPAIERGLRDAALRRERKAMEQQLLHALKMEAIGQLTGGIAHDFNNLLGIIVGNIELLLESAEGNDNVTELATTVLNTALRGAQLTHRLLAFARQQPLDPQVIELNAPLPSIVDMLRRTLGAHIHISTLLADDLWLTRADPSRIEDTLINLAINARDAMPDGGAITIETANVELDEHYAALNAGLQPGQYVRLSVTDDGVGMSPDVVARATEPFFTTKRQGKGTGLGLAMIYGFAKQSGGHLKIYSEPGHGTTVRLYLPRAADASAAAPPAPAAPELPRGRGERILLVDDNHDLRRVAELQLDELGYRVRSADSGAVALSIIDAGAVFDLLLTDIGMPDGMSGYELAEAARRRQPGLKILFTTGYAKVQGTRKAADPPAGPMLRKPYRKQDLAKLLRATLDTGG